MKPMNQLVRIVLYLLCIGVMVGGILYIDTKVRFLWTDVAYRQSVLQDVPAETSQTAALKKELDSALVTMETISQTVPTEDGLVGVISAISNAATVSGINAQVPIVSSSAEKKTDTDDASANDLFSDVRINVVASGDPAALASFLHRVEHLPYILRIAFWKIDTIQQSSITPYTGPEAVESPEIAPTLGSSLEAEVAIVTRKKSILPSPPTP